MAITITQYKYDPKVKTMNGQIIEVKQSRPCKDNTKMGDHI